MLSIRNSYAHLRSFSIITLASLMLLAPLCAEGLGQAQAGAGQEKVKPKTGKGAFSVKISKRTPQILTVKATEARVADIANEIGRLLNVAVSISPTLAKSPLTVDFGGLTLDASLRQLAPRAYIDYEISGDTQQSRVLAIYLYGNNENPPTHSVAVKNNSEAQLIEGHTEEGTEEYEKEKEKEEQVLKVSYQNNLLSILARKQPLSIVLFKIASELGVPLDLRYESSELVDVEFKNYPVDQAIRSLSPLVRLYVRADLQNFEMQPLRIALVAPASIKS